MKRLSATLAFTLALAGLGAAPAGAAFGLQEVGVELTDPGGAPSLQAGSHPFEMATRIEMNTTLMPEGGDCKFEFCELPDGAAKDLTVELPAGFVGDPHAVPRCSATDFIEIEEGGGAACPDATVLGRVALKLSFSPLEAGSGLYLHLPVYNLIPPPGVAVRLGFSVPVPVTIDATLNPNPPYNVVAHATNISQVAFFTGSVLYLWGNPASPLHDPFRGDCLKGGSTPPGEPESGGECPVEAIERKPFFTVPRSCTGPLSTIFSALAWNTGETDSKVALTEPGMVNCPALPFESRITAQPTTDRAESPSGLDFNLQIDDEGLTNPAEGATALSDIRKAVVTLPEGVTINPSQAEGLAVCSEAQLAAETLESEFGEGCPPASKIGSVEVESQLLEGEVFKGSLFVAEPYKNRFGSLLAIYQVIRHRDLGLLVKLAGRVEPDPRTGQLITTFDDLPQLPVSDFRLHFREGGRSPLVTPPSCDSNPSTPAQDPYTTTAVFTPWANPTTPFTTTASFQITRGVGGAPCPPPGTPPFEPGFSAGTLNNNAASYSPFLMRLTRRDGDQDLTRFDATLPPGVTAKLAGVSQCPEAAIAATKAKAGKEELASPSCPANSKIGSVWAGAGVGSQLTYVPGSVYLAGPFGGAPLSVLGVVPAVAGPFDVGTVVTRQALVIDPRTALVRVDGALSDPIPHILAGIPLKVRDIRVNVDRPDFTLNPTSCDPSEVGAALWGGGFDVFSAADDSPVARADRFQAANCALLGFKPRLTLRLKGGTKRAAHPALTAILIPRPGDANIAAASAALPRSEFLENAHIRTVCTRAEFASESCPKGAIYGRATAFSPLLDEKVTGPVYLRSSSNLLPDLVADLRGPPSLPVKFEVIGRTDSVNGGIRNSFDVTPDVPVSKFVLKLQGGRKGLLVNSRDICKRAYRATVKFSAHNGRRATLRPKLRADCGKEGKRGKQAKRRAHKRR